MIGKTLLLKGSFSKNILNPYPVYATTLTSLVESPETLNCIPLETPAKLVSVYHEQSAKPFLLVHIKLPLIVTPVVRTIQVEILIISYIR